MLSLITPNNLIKKIVYNRPKKGVELDKILKILNINKVLSVPMDGDCAFWCLYVILSYCENNFKSILKKHIEDIINSGSGNFNAEELYIDFYSKKNNLEDIIKKLNRDNGKILINSLRMLIAECYMEQLIKIYNLEDALFIYNDSKVGEARQSITNDSLEAIIKKCMSTDILMIIPAYENNKFWQIKKNNDDYVNFPSLNDLKKKNILFNSNNHYYLLLN